MEATKPIRVYAKKRFGAYPEVDKHILVDLNAKPHQRYLVDGEDFKKNLVDARKLVAERLQLKAPQIVAATEVHYTPATGFKQPNHRLLKPTDEGTTMNAVADKVAQQTSLPNIEAKVEVEVPTGKWADAVQKLTNWEAKNPKPTAPGALLDAWNKDHKRLQDSILYQKGVVKGTHKPRGPQAGIKKAAERKPLAKAAPISEAKTTNHAPKVVYKTAPKFEATIQVGGIKMQIDTLPDLENAVAMIKGLAR